MGTLHTIYQLKPKLIVDGAILPVKKEAQQLFLEQYPKKNSHWGIFSNTFVRDAPQGKVPRVAIYAPERKIDFQKAGLYIALQSGSKYGFDQVFEEQLQALAPFLEDALFYVTWDTLMSQYQIIQGALHIQTTKNFDAWDYDFGQYLEANYSQSSSLLAAYYWEELLEFKAHHEELLVEQDAPYSYYDKEDYEEYWAKLLLVKKYDSSKEGTALEAWLQEQLLHVPEE